MYVSFSLLLALPSYILLFIPFCSDRLFVDLQPFLGKDIEIAIYTIQGREISKLFKGSIVENGPMEFDIPNIGNGYYVIGVYSQNGIQSIPFSVVKE